MNATVKRWEGGDITFLSDCSHALTGQTVALPEWERP